MVCKEKKMGSHEADLWDMEVEKYTIWTPNPQDWSIFFKKNLLTTDRSRDRMQTIK